MAIPLLANDDASENSFEGVNVHYITDFGGRRPGFEREVPLGACGINDTKQVMARAMGDTNVTFYYDADVRDLWVKINGLGHPHLLLGS